MKLQAPRNVKALEYPASALATLSQAVDAAWVKTCPTGWCLGVQLEWSLEQEVAKVHAVQSCWSQPVQADCTELDEGA